MSDAAWAAAVLEASPFEDNRVASYTPAHPSGSAEAKRARAVAMQVSGSRVRQRRRHSRSPVLRYDKWVRHRARLARPGID